jgi:hypothetical protein
MQVVNREIYSDGYREHRVLLDTAPIPQPLATRQEYGPRTSIEERHRQLKSFSDLAGFTSRGALSSRQASGLCVVDVQLAAVVLQELLLTAGGGGAPENIN